MNHQTLKKSESYVKSSVQNGIGTIEFYHPQSNAMPSSQLTALAKAIEEMGHDPEIRVIVLKSAGNRAFCAGASFDELMAIENEEIGLKFFSGFANVINAMRKAPKFVLVQVQGKAVGGGVGIAAAGDYTLATEAASVKLSELAVGIGPFVVGPAVERKVGKSAFAQLTIDATQFRSAEWAVQNGLYAASFPDPDELENTTFTLAEKLSKSSPAAMAEIKSMLWAGSEDWDKLLVARAKISGKLVLSDFTRNAIQAFKNK